MKKSWRQAFRITGAMGVRIRGNDLDDTNTTCSDSEAYHVDEREAFAYNFRQVLGKIFEGTANKTVLISETQMNEIKRSIAADYTERLLRYSQKVDHGVELHLLCASHVMDQFLEALDKIRQTKMPSTTQEAIFQEMEMYICPRIVYQLDPMNNLTPDAAAKAVTWISKFQDEMTRVGLDLELREEWVKGQRSVLDFYLDRAVRHETTILLQEVLKLHSDGDIRRNEEGNLVTSLPEDITYVFNQQLKVASGCLPDKFKEDILMACNDELAGMIGDFMFRISSEWEQMSAAHFCAVINDTSRLAEYCEKRHKECLTRPELIEAAKNITRDITEMSLHATRYLCERVMLDLREPEPILTSVGDAVWESPECHSAVDRTIATFKDFFADFQQWLIRDYFFPKVLKNCFDLALKTYLESFFANTMIRGANGPVSPVEELEQDFLRFVFFFNDDQFLAYHGRGGFYSQKVITDHLCILQHMAAIMDPTNLPGDLSFEIQEVLAYFGEHENGVPAVLHLVGLRRRQRGIGPMHWVTEIASAKKELAKRGKRNIAPLSCTIPDVRNSTRLRNSTMLRRLRSLSPGQKQHVDGKENAKENQNPEAHKPTEELEDDWLLFFEGRMLAEF
uniref:Exocyst complex component Sec6 n=1 Tax=Amphora coffeiformis TaxID=265554 RepID=A0A7S3P2W5_9STRA